MKTFALCFNIPDLQGPLFREPAVCKKFPGAGWMPHFATLAEERRYGVMHGADALIAVMRGEIRAVDVIVIQEEENRAGQELCEHGAKAAVLTCFESPLFTPYFYDKLHTIAPYFEETLLFTGSPNHLHFPIFEMDDIQEPVKWAYRRELVMVSANKHYMGMPRHDSSKSFAMAMTHQLHDMRYSAIEYFKKRGLLDLYGRGWPEILGLPCEDKVATMRNYRFAICFENVAIPGYITEKIIDCFVAGTIPIYWGAPDVADYIPRAAYLDAKSYKNWEELERALTSISTDEAMLMIQAGRQFLEGRGQKHGNAQFAKDLLDLAERAS